MLDASRVDVVTENIRTIVAFVARSPHRCWRAFTDANLLVAWVPGLRRAKVIASRPDGLAAEVMFEFSTSLVYSLVYDYDIENHEVRWEPRSGKRDGVRGFARIEPWDGGSRLVYGLELGGGRDVADTTLSEPRALVSAFARWVEGDRRGSRAELRL